jgi:23S rRNA (guanosine2251-2'-O)-methyltransferase
VLRRRGGDRTVNQPRRGSGKQPKPVKPAKSSKTAGRTTSSRSRRAGGQSTRRSRDMNGREAGERRRAGGRRASAIGGEQVEGRQAVRELLLAGHRRVHELWVAAELDQRGGVEDLIALAHDQRVPVQQVSRRRLAAQARSESPQGVLARAASLPEADLDDLVVARSGRPAPFLVLVDGVTDPGNLGALLRSAEGAGVTGVVLPRHRAAHVTPTVAKAAAGAIEHVPLALAPGLPSVIERLKRSGVWVVGLHDASSKPLFELGDLARGPIALVFGAEGAGLARLTRERCDLLVSIPMHGALSSLNVSAAAALACYEVARQRA